MDFESVCSVPQLREGFVSQMKELKYCKSNVCHYKVCNETQPNSTCIVLESIYVYIEALKKNTNITMQDLLWSGFEGFIASFVL